MWVALPTKCVRRSTDVPPLPWFADVYTCGCWQSTFLRSFVTFSVCRRNYYSVTVNHLVRMNSPIRQKQVRLFTYVPQTSVVNSSGELLNSSDSRVFSSVTKAFGRDSCFCPFLSSNSPSATFSHPLPSELLLSPSLSRRFPRAGLYVCLLPCWNSTLKFLSQCFSDFSIHNTSFFSLNST